MSTPSGVPSVDALVQGAGSAHEFDVNDVFSLRKPKDLAGGVSSGLQSIGKSVLMGASALVAAPIVGARTEGAAGFAKGLGLGVASAAILPVVGASVGAVQMVRGACATPEAMANTRAGKRWDSRARRWVADDLRAEAEALGATTDEEILDRARARAEARGARPGVQGLFDEAAGGGGAGPAETEYYDVLECEPTSTAAEIRRKYYVLARKLHPDKNLGDPSAKERFQKIGEAYQVLSDDSLRKRYDARGKDGLGDVPIVNPSAFFGMLFGSEQMESWIGRLKLATMAMAGTDLSSEEQDLLQSRRETRLAIKLAAMLDVYVDFDLNAPKGTDRSKGEQLRAQAFVDTMRPVAEHLADVSFGAVLLRKIGWVYQLEAEKFLHDPLAGTGTWLDLGLRSTGATLQQKGSTMKNKFNVLKAGVSIFNSVQSSEQQVAKAQNEEEATALRAKQQQDILPHILDALWGTTAVDIESTLRHVCAKVLKDASANRVRRAMRAKALVLLGKLFQETKGSNTDANDATRTLEEAIRAAFMNGHEEEQDA
jgi:curved DNA-binding protein CbpA